MPAIDAPQQCPPQRLASSQEQLVAANYARLYRWFLWLTNNSSDAADLTQETFVAVWQSLHRFETHKPMAPWLFGIARNVWRNHNSARAQRASTTLELLQNPPPATLNPEEIMLAREASALLERAVAELPADYREAVVLRFWEDLGYSEIAEALSISEGLARWRVHQARKLLAHRLQDRGVPGEQAFRAGGKVGWWMRIHQRCAPPENLLERCMSTIPAATVSASTPLTIPLPKTSGAQLQIAPAPSRGNGTAESAVTLRVGTIQELRTAGCIVTRHDGRNVAVFYDDGKIRAVENRCPHMGFPLHRGSIKDGILTCFWHHARFDLASGSTFDLWADDLPTYPVEVRDDQVWLLPRPPRDEVAHWRARLREAMQQNIPLVMAKSVLGLLQRGVEPVEIVRQALLFGSCYRDDWNDGLTILAANANLLGHLDPQEHFLPLWHGVVRVANNLYQASPHWDRRPLATDQVPAETLRRWLRQWVSVRHRDGAERCLLTALAGGAGPAEISDLLLTAATDRIYGDGGHIVDFINKAIEAVELIGWEHAPEVLPTLISRLVGARGAEETSYWREPIDVVSMLRQVDQQLPAVLEEGRRKQIANTAATDCTQLSDMLLGDDPAVIMQRIQDALASGITPADIAKVVAYTAAVRICRFGPANEFSDWISVLHTFTYCNAIHQLLKRIGREDPATAGPTSSPRIGPSPEALRGLFHGAMRIYLDRFLNVPPAPMPAGRGREATGEGANEEAHALLAQFLTTLDRQAQVAEAVRIVARYLSLGYPAAQLIQTLARAVMREDAEFHTYQMLEAAVRQYEEWRGTPQGNHVLIAAARYIAAHSPTQRELLQTGDIVQRLYRGECLHEEERCAGE
jgi:RNA polymerase sigma factor (sigma-70 family)